NVMKKISLILIAFFSIQSLQAQTLNEVWNSVFGSKNSGSKTTTKSGSGISKSSLSNTEIVSGLKEALTVGSNNAGSKLHSVNGYFGNALIKILMPPEAKKVESTLRQLGMGNVVDKAILSMNRA